MQGVKKIYCQNKNHTFRVISGWGRTLFNGPPGVGQKKVGQTLMKIAWLKKKAAWLNPPFRAPGWKLVQNRVKWGEIKRALQNNELCIGNRSFEPFLLQSKKKTAVTVQAPGQDQSWSKGGSWAGKRWMAGWTSFPGGGSSGKQRFLDLQSS